MTLDTRIYVHDPVDYREVWLKCNQLIGADERTKFTDEPDPVWEKGERKGGDKNGEWWIWNKPGQGLCALLDIRYRKNGPVLGDGQHHRYCEPDEETAHKKCFPHWLEVSFDTAYSFRSDTGEGCGDLHARLVAELGKWLDGKGLHWSWENEFTGQIHQGYEGLTELSSGGASAASWFRDIVAPALGLETP